MLPCSRPSSLPNCIILFLQIDDLTSKLETVSSKCLHLGRKNQVLQQELLLMKTIQKKCLKLEKKKRKLEQEVESLRSHMEKNMVEHSQVQQYKQEVEEQARQDLVEKLKQVNLFLQVSLFLWWVQFISLQMRSGCVHSVCLLWFVSQGSRETRTCASSCVWVFFIIITLDLSLENHLTFKAILYKTDC